MVWIGLLSVNLVVVFLDERYCEQLGMQFSWCCLFRIQEVLSDILYKIGIVVQFCRFIILEVEVGGREIDFCVILGIESD